MENKNSPEILKNLQRNCLVPERKNRIFGAMLIFLVLGGGFCYPDSGWGLSREVSGQKMHGEGISWTITLIIIGIAVGIYNVWYLFVRNSSNENI